MTLDRPTNGVSSRRIVRVKPAYEGEDMLLTTAFCLLNLPNHYRKRNKINDAKCWMERDGKGKHCICSQNFCNHLRDRRIPLQGNMPLINASLTEHNPLIDYDYTSENEADFTFDLVHLEDDANVIASDPSSKDLIPIEMENSEYKDVPESSLQKSLRPTLSLSSSPSSSSLSSLSPSSNNEYRQLLTNNYTTEQIPNQNFHFYAVNEEKKRKPPHDISIMNAIHPDQMLQQIEGNMTLPGIASSNSKISFIYFKIMLLLKLFSAFYV
ncbi:unnamed protein product [Wuchereria bancrofti]|uniref:Uncharacterized protein n=1 Tax=Wuchereria bancrofti TaxID=6293 RepID=A0A3P7EBM9_WUCBA|nr:unnamed protein product [Wuchereria bancrofti]